MVARRVAKGRYEELMAWLREGEQLATDFPGYLGSGVLAPPPNDDEFQIIFRFANEQTLHAFQHANPHFFYVYELLGDYYHATGQQDKALRNWKKALLLPIPKRSESERIEHKINN